MTGQTPHRPPVLVSGGTDTTGHRVTQQLAGHDIATPPGSRSGEPPPDRADGAAVAPALRNVTPGAATIAVAPPMLELVGLHKSFGDIVAVDHVDLLVPARAFFGAGRAERGRQVVHAGDGRRAAAS